MCERYTNETKQSGKTDIRHHIVGDWMGEEKKKIKIKIHVEFENELRKLCALALKVKRPQLSMLSEFILFSDSATYTAFDDDEEDDDNNLLFVTTIFACVSHAIF